MHPERGDGLDERVVHRARAGGPRSAPQTESTPRIVASTRRAVTRTVTPPGQ